MNIIAKITGFFKDLLTKIFPHIKSAAKAFIMDEAIQTAAYRCAEAAMREGLTGDKAWVYARDELVRVLGGKAKGIATNWIDTVLQNAVFALKNKI